MILQEIVKVKSLLRSGDILLVYTKNNIISAAIQYYESSLNRNEFPIYANHVVQIYDTKYCLDQLFPIADFSENKKYLCKEHEIAIVRPNFDNDEIIKCKRLMIKDNGTLYNIFQIVGFILQWICYKLFKKKIENYFDIKAASVCGGSVLKRLKKISLRFDISKEEYHDDYGLVTPMDFLRACKINHNFKFVYGTGKFNNILGDTHNE